MLNVQQYASARSKLQALQCGLNSALKTALGRKDLAALKRDRNRRNMIKNAFLTKNFFDKRDLLQKTVDYFAQSGRIN
jgi:hypothetical protein